MFEFSILVLIKNSDFNMYGIYLNSLMTLNCSSDNRTFSFSLVFTLQLLVRRERKINVHVLFTDADGSLCVGRQGIQLWVPLSLRVYSL